MFQLNFISEAQIAHVLMPFWSWWLLLLQHGSRFLDVLPSRFQTICQQFVHHLTLEASQVSQEVFHLAAMTYCNEAIWPKSRATKSNSQKIRWKYLKHPKTTLRNMKFTLDIVYLVFTLVILVETIQTSAPQHFSGFIQNHSQPWQHGRQWPSRKTFQLLEGDMNVCIIDTYSYILW